MKNLRKNLRLSLLLLGTVILSQHQINAEQQTINLGNALLQGQSLRTQELPLHKIVLNQDYTTQEKLDRIKDALDNKVVDVNAQDADGKTALNLITFYNSDAVLAQLLIVQYKANVNIPDRFNVSPLHNAIEKEEIEIAKMLLDAGADRDLKNDADEITPVDLARSEKTMALLGLEA